MQNPQVTTFTTMRLGMLVGYSTQQVRDLERLGVIPAAERGVNGYRRYRMQHATALHAYRAMAAALGPVPARRLMPVLIGGSIEDAADRIDDLHADLAHERSRVREALRALDIAVAEADDVFAADDAMTVGELAGSRRALLGTAPLGTRGSRASASWRHVDPFVRLGRDHRGASRRCPSLRRLRHPRRLTHSR